MQFIELPIHSSITDDLWHSPTACVMLSLKIFCFRSKDKHAKLEQITEIVK